MKTVHQRVYPATKDKLNAIKNKINASRNKLGHKEITVPELVEFLVEYYMENDND